MKTRYVTSFNVTLNPVGVNNDVLALPLFRVNIPSFRRYKLQEIYVYNFVINRAGGADIGIVDYVNLLITDQDTAAFNPVAPLDPQIVQSIGQTRLAFSKGQLFLRDLNIQFTFEQPSFQFVLLSEAGFLTTDVNIGGGIRLVFEDIDDSDSDTIQITRRLDSIIKNQEVL